MAEEYITKAKQPLTTMHVDRLTTPALQKVNETIAKGKAESKSGGGMEFRDGPLRRIICFVICGVCSIGEGVTFTIKLSQPRA